MIPNWFRNTQQINKILKKIITEWFTRKGKLYGVNSQGNNFCCYCSLQKTLKDAARIAQAPTCAGRSRSIMDPSKTLADFLNNQRRNSGQL